jgi:long-chain-fatty-acyl-CoA reductase
VETIRLPILVGGERRLPGEDVARFSYHDEFEIVLPQVPLADVRRIVASDRAPLRDLSIDDVAIFFDQVSKAWSDPSNEWRKRVVSLAARVTGYPEAIVAFDVATVAETLTRAKQYDFISTDLGNPALLDEWSPEQAVYKRCWPAGLVTHVMVGNVPLAALFTLYRSLATKNITVAKLPKRDVVTALCFAQTIYEVDPKHPITKALSTFYWQPESEIENFLLQSSDVVSVWGRGSSVDSIKRRLRHGVDCVEFGPKRSFALVLNGVPDVGRVARRIAHDVSVYDQEACFSAQEIHVQGDHGAFVAALTRWLDGGSRGLPRRPLTTDAEAHVHRARLEAQAEGWRVIAPKGTDWTIIVTDGPAAIPDHPLSRLVYVHPFDSLDQVLRLVDRNVQTVAVEPWSRVWEVADKLTGAGVDRIVPSGRMTVFRPGFIHDGFHPMRRMVRWSIVERPVSTKYRFAGAGIEQLEEMVIASRLTPPDAGSAKAAE